jgi:hypothetical protein
MSKESKKPVLVSNPEPVADDNPGPFPLVMRLADTDRLNLELARSKRQVALATAKQAVAESDLAEMNYKYFVLQLYMRYGLTDRDAINEAGEILRNQVNPVGQGQ